MAEQGRADDILSWIPSDNGSERLWTTFCGVPLCYRRTVHHELTPQPQGLITMDTPDGTHIPVRLHNLSKAVLPNEERSRHHFGTIYFPEGTSANDVCVTISKKHGANTGLWLLQTPKVKSTAGSKAVNNNEAVLTNDMFDTIKDAKHRLVESSSGHYVALHYTGPDIFLVT